MKKPMKQPVFKVGDLVTYKYSKDCPNNKYYYGGECHGGWRGKVISIASWKSDKNCYDIIVTTKTESEYVMVESEFLEYDEAISTKEPDLLLYKEGDYIKFDLGDKVLKYIVGHNHLRNVTDELNISDSFNDQIFSLLGLEKRSFCTEHYGYAPREGSFPISRYEDFAALTRVVNALQKECKQFREQKHSTTKDVSSESPLKVGKWYVKYDTVFPTGYIIMCYQGKDNYHYGINGVGDWSQSLKSEIGPFIPIDGTQLVLELSKIATKKGIVKGTHIKMLKNLPGQKSDFPLKSNCLFKTYNNTFTMGGYTVLDEYGNWAEVWKDVEKGVEEKEKSASIYDLQEELKIIADEGFIHSTASYVEDAKVYMAGCDRYPFVPLLEKVKKDDYISITGSSIQVKKLRKRRK